MVTSLLKINQKRRDSSEFIDGMYRPAKIKGWRVHDPHGPIEGVIETVDRVSLFIIEGPSLAGIGQGYCSSGFLIRQREDNRSGEKE
ncbi:MAG TPA: hypothetical protein VH107_11870 [Lacipirellulaceae bacterium]|jgi:hypothetical protein|nr:hypothetical protein [Lacipirellulaceae bacterium]